MINDKLQKKIDFALKLLKSIPSDDIELCFSGGKDSSVILQLAKMAGIMDKVTPIYKNTTIDPKGNVAFCKSQGCEVIRPKKTFFQLIEISGFPTRRSRHCCRILKEYKVKDYAILGIRTDESDARSDRYNEPEVCRAYGNNNKPKRDRSNVVKHYYPILEWDNQDVCDFLEYYKVEVNPFYTEDYGGGYLDVTRRLGCKCCPLKSQRLQRKDFEDNPKFVRAWIKAGIKWWNRPHTDRWNSGKKFGTIYDLFYHNLFCYSYKNYLKKSRKNTLFPLDCKKYLEEYFNVKLP